MRQDTVPVGAGLLPTHLGRIWALPRERWPPARRVPSNRRQKCRIGDRRSSHRTKSLAVLQQAARLERALRYTEPPTYPRPVSEVVGRKAIEDGRPQMAEAAFRDALDQFPESSRALSGLAEAQRREGKSQGSGF